MIFRIIAIIMTTRQIKPMHENTIIVIIMFWVNAIYSL